VAAAILSNVRERAQRRRPMADQQEPPVIHTLKCFRVSFITVFAALAACALGAAALVTGGGCASGPTNNSGPAVTSSGQVIGLDPKAFTRLWTAGGQLEDNQTATAMYVVDDRVYMYTSANDVHVFLKDTGELQYLIQPTEPGHVLWPPLSMADKKLVFPTNHTLEVFNRQTGGHERSIDIGGTITSPGVSIGSDVYIGTDVTGGRLAQFDITNQFRPFKQDVMVFGAVQGAPAVIDNTIAVASADGGVRDINSDDLKTSAWPYDEPLNRGRFMTGGPIKADVVADDAGVYVASTSGRFFCLDKHTGRLKWQYFAGQVLETGPSVTATTVYLPVPEQGIVALDKTKLVTVSSEGHQIEQQNRTARWSVNNAVQFLCEDDHFAYLRTPDNVIEAADKATGRIIYRSGKTSLGLFVTNTKDPMIYAATTGGQIVAVKPTVTPGM
jgi:outer membrane protein assembly factor BamB